MERLEDRLTPSTYYVDQLNNACSDTGPGSASQPFCHIQTAADKAVAGDIAIVNSGTYSEMVTVKASGNSSAPVLFEAADGANVTVSGGTNGFYISGLSWVTVRGFKITNTSGAGIYVSGSSHITIDSNDVSYAGQPKSGLTARGVYLSGTTDSTVLKNTVHHNTNSGIYLTSGTTRVDVAGNVTYSNASQYTRQAPGIDLRSAGNTVENNVSHDNEDSGIQLYPDASNNLVVNNLSYNNGDHGIDIYGGDRNATTGNRVIGNSVYHNVTAGINVEGGSPNTTLANNVSVDNGIDSPRTRGNIRVDSSSVSGTAIDYDLVFLTTPPGAQVMIIWNSTSYYSLADMVAASGQETHGIQGDPLWTAPASGNMHLGAGSPAIDSANSGASGQSATDLEGQSRYDDPGTANTGTGPRSYDDRGAYEFHAAGGTISGLVFQDANSNGVQDAGEYGVAGWTIFLDANQNGTLDAGESSTVTATDGTYSFSNLAPDIYRVREVPQSGWTQTTADPADITISAGSNVSNVNFGDHADFQNISISGHVFQDGNGNGTLDGSDSGIAGRTIFLDANANGTLDGGEMSTVTDASGNYAFTELGPGTYRVREVLPTGWLQTTADPADIVASSGNNVSGVNFGTFQTITISGKLFQDSSGNGILDGSDAGISGRTVFLDANNNGLLDSGETSTTTDVSGNYTFAGLGPGTYRVRQVLPSGWLQTTANPADITATSGNNVSDQNLGDFQTITISGQVFQDSNGNGKKDSGEAGLSGWTIQLLDSNGNVIATTTTNKKGNYSFSGIGPGTYKVHEVVKNGWTETTTDPLIVTTSSGVNVSGENFGDKRA